MSSPARPSLVSIITPGILLAATGVGAGDLLTASLAGSEAGLGVLWAVAAGAVLKWTLSEGLARWQLATGSTLLEGWVWRLGRWIQWIFLAYLLLFTVTVGGALVTACGVAGTGLFPLGEPPVSKVIWGVAHSLVGFLLVRYGSFGLFEKLMSAFVGLMFVCVVLTLVLSRPDWSQVAAGFIPVFPPPQPRWLVAVLGGVGGTVTLLSYGYWIQEQGRREKKDVSVCRLDLAVAYTVTAIFGISMIVIGSRLEVMGGGSTLALQLAGQLELVLGGWGRVLFLLGFWGAVFSSLLGVWQSIPYMFADFMELRSGSGARRHIDLRQTPAYRWYLVFLSVVPLALLGTTVRGIQLAYGIIGALFLPLLALTLLILNNRRHWVGADYRSGWLYNAILMLGLLFFAYVGVGEIVEMFEG